MAPKQMMKATVLSEFGATPEVRDVPMPQPGSGEVRVRVRAASINGFDVSVAKGRTKDFMEHRFPLILGMDFAGVVDEVGAEVTVIAPGQRVFGEAMKPFLGEGSFAEYVVVPPALVAPLPDGVDFASGGSLSLAGITARQVVDAAELVQGQTVLIAGATGGVGTIAVQLAAQTGAQVIATARGDEARRVVSSLGASHVLDYTQDLAGQLRAIHPAGVDAVLHLAGDPQAVLALVRPGGRLVSTLLMSPDQLPSDSVQVIGIMQKPSRKAMEDLAAAVAAKHLRIVVQRTYRLDEAPKALSEFAQPGTLGKLVLTND